MSSQVPQQPPPLDFTIYNLEDDEIAFFKAQTGIQNENELREHILAVQAEAYAVHPYWCIRSLAFTNLKISRYSPYKAVLKIGRERPDAILLDLGCCFGNDARKAIADGFPLENVLASDLRPEFWDLGHKLFKSSPETFPVPFLAGDVFDPNFLSPNQSPAPTSDTPPPRPPPLSTLASLSPLQHQIAVIHTSSFFHLFSEAQQRILTHLVGSLLSPLPGSMILGSHMGLPDTDENNRGGTRLTSRGTTTFAHSPTSWENLWVGEGGVFEPGDVVLWTQDTETKRRGIAQGGGDTIYKAHRLVWSVTRA